MGELCEGGSCPGNYGCRLGRCKDSGDHSCVEAFSEGAGGSQLQTKAPAECCEEACDRGVHP
jgi:hypothetical protein